MTRQWLLDDIIYIVMQYIVKLAQWWTIYMIYIINVQSPLASWAPDVELGWLKLLSFFHLFSGQHIPRQGSCHGTQVVPLFFPFLPLLPRLLPLPLPLAPPWLLECVGGARLVGLTGSTGGGGVCLEEKKQPVLRYLYKPQLLFMVPYYTYIVWWPIQYCSIIHSSIHWLAYAMSHSQVFIGHLAVLYQSTHAQCAGQQVEGGRAGGRAGALGLMYEDNLL